MKATSGPCILCGAYLQVSTGRNTEGRILYARFEGITVPVGQSCESHFIGTPRNPKASWSPPDPTKPIHLRRPGVKV